MKKLVLSLVFLLGLLSGTTHAQQQLEIIKLQSRTADQVLPQLRPFVEPGGTLSGMNNQIFIRASEANRRQIKELLAAIDRPPRRLLISVRQDADSSATARGGEVSGRVSSGGTTIESRRTVVGGAGVEVRRGGDVVRGQVYDSRSAGSERVSQQVQVVEGGKAYINVGTSVPVPLRQVVVGPGGAVVSESVVYRDLGTGFTAEPQLAGDNVTLSISPTHDTPGAYGPGSANIQRLTTTVSGRLGEWIDLGGSVEERSGESSGLARHSTRGGSSARRVQLRVEELP
ncbi:MAG: hypothetical protein K8F56_09025 [Rhodocyclaceae bacterium]|nr:hypothetical protein [Rhodocyclaceae bacterium]MBZ0143712.1 hypothetical protein [Rhodocyclaceae bacterium]MCC6879928.1 hypothetical protein [Rhodocyclaceae bacterium]